MNTRFLGAACLVGGLIGVADAVRRIVLAQPLGDGLIELDTVTLLAFMVAALGGLCGVLGMLSLRATGTNPIFRVLTSLPAISYLATIVVCVGLLTGLVTSDPNNPVVVTLWALVDILGPASWLVVGILTIAAKAWVGWRRFVPLLFVLAFVLGVATSASTGLVGLFGIFAYAAVALLGYAVYSTTAAAPVGTVIAKHA